MRARIAVSIVLGINILAGAGAQTITSPPPICFSFNDTGSTAPPPSISVDSTAGMLTVHFTAPVSAAIERVDFRLPYIYGGPCVGSGGGYALHATSSPGGAILVPALTTFTLASVVEPSSGWTQYIRLSTPTVQLTAGASYALLAQGFCLGCSYMAYDVAGTTPLTYQVVQSCQPSTPASGQLPFAMRFRGTACGPGPLASVTSLGGTSSVPWIAPGGGNTPVLGAPWFGIACSSLAAITRPSAPC